MLGCDMHTDGMKHAGNNILLSQENNYVNDAGWWLHFCIALGTNYCLCCRHLTLHLSQTIKLLSPPLQSIYPHTYI